MKSTKSGSLTAQHTRKNAYRLAAGPVSNPGDDRMRAGEGGS